MRCEKTRQFIQGFGKQTPLPWSEIIRTRDLPLKEQALDFIAKLVRLDANERIDAHKAIQHDFLKTYMPIIPVEKGCPFKVNFYLKLYKK